MTWWSIAAREQGKYEAIGGHAARGGGSIDRATGRESCAVCGRPLTWRGDKHAGGKRRRR